MDCVVGSTVVEEPRRFDQCDGSASHWRRRVRLDINIVKSAGFHNYSTHNSTLYDSMIHQTSFRLIFVSQLFSSSHLWFCSFTLPFLLLLRLVSKSPDSFPLNLSWHYIDTYSVSLVLSEGQPHLAYLICLVVLREQSAPLIYFTRSSSLNSPSAHKKLRLQLSVEQVLPNDVHKMRAVTSTSPLSLSSCSCLNRG